MKSNNILKIVNQAIKYMWKIDKKYFALGLIFALVSAIDPLYNILPLKIVLDMLATDFSIVRCLLFFLCVLSFAVLTNFFAQWYRNRYLPVLNLNVQHETRKKVFTKSYDINYANFDDPSFYDNYKLVLNQIDNGITGITRSLFGFLAQVLSVLVVGSIVLVTDPVLIFLVIFQVTLSVLLNIKSGKINYEFDVENIPHERKKQYVGRLFYLQDFLKDLKVLDFLEVLFDWQKNSYNESIKVVKKFSLKKSTISFLSTLINMMLKICIYIYLAWSVFEGKNSLGDFASMVAATVSLSSLLTNLASIIPNMDRQCRYVDKLFEYISPTSSNASRTPVVFKNELSFEKISFKYPGSAKIVLNNLSLNIKSGQRIAIIGENGAGKSTLINLLMGLYVPDCGEIVVDSTRYDIEKFPLFINNAATILQSSRVYAFTIAENILMHPINSYNDVLLVNKALEYAGLAEKVRSLPYGIKTNLSTEFDPQGVQFSGGEIQKLALARAYASGKNLWIFDEPSSNLDPIAEHEFYKKMFDAPKDKTILFVSHKMRSASLADIIFFMHDGAFVESGTHEELMRKKGRYYDFYMIQNSEVS